MGAEPVHSTIRVRALLASTSDFYGLVPDSHQLEGDDQELDAEAGATSADHG